MRLRLHVFRILKCSPGREAAAAAHRFTGAAPANCRIRGPEIPQSQDSGLLWRFQSPTPTVLVFHIPKFHLQGEASVYRRENLFLKALIVLAIIGAISVKGDEAIVSDLWQFRHAPPVVYSQSQSLAPLGSAPLDKWMQVVAVC